MASLNQAYGLNCGSNSSHTKIIGCNFTGNTSDKNIIGVGSYKTWFCTGVPDTLLSNYGSTAERPSSPPPGFEFFDTQIGLPIFWNPVTNHWIRADGVDDIELEGKNGGQAVGVINYIWS
ncbi:hypothetical protein P5X50_23450, partial [Enterobacter hormaechei]|uniref:hypothetical protein n=5 Tax=Enterobacter hormaechei TaxID=158836 RepID=UPI0023F7ED38